MTNKHLATYLQDHVAGSVAALELLGHLETVHAGSDLQRFFAALRGDIEADRTVLDTLIERVASSAGTLRAAAWFGEKATRLKLQMDDTAGGNFRLLEAVELVAVGIEGKWGLRVALAEVSAFVAELRGPDYRRLTDRAVEQRRRIEPIRLNAARSVFSLNM